MSFWTKLCLVSEVLAVLLAAYCSATGQNDVAALNVALSCYFHLKFRYYDDQDSKPAVINNVFRVDP